MATRVINAKYDGGNGYKNHQTTCTFTVTSDTGAVAGTVTKVTCAFSNLTTYQNSKTIGLYFSTPSTSNNSQNKTRSLAYYSATSATSGAHTYTFTVVNTTFCGTATGSKVYFYNTHGSNDDTKNITNYRSGCTVVITITYTPSNTPPDPPTVNYPVAGTTTYNPQPYVLITVGEDAQSNPQTLTASGYDTDTTGTVTEGDKVLYRRTSAATVGSESFSVTSTDSGGKTSSAATRTFTIAAASFTDDPLVSNETHIKAVHMNELRDMIDTIRACYGMGAYPWVQTITAGTTSLAGWTTHVTEMRTAIDEVVTFVNGWDSNTSTIGISLPTWISITSNKPSVAVMNQIRNAISQL